MAAVTLQASATNRMQISTQPRPCGHPCEDLTGLTFAPFIIRSFMRRHLLSHRRTRLRLMLLFVLSMLFQQFALAAYVCPMTGVPAAGMTAMSGHCHGMSASQQKQTPILCAEHCAQQTPATQDARLPNVPPLLMPALLPSSLPMVITYASGTLLRSDTAAPVIGLAPTLRFRVLLI